MKGVLALVVLAVLIVLVVWLVKTDFFDDIGGGITGDYFKPYDPKLPDSGSNNDEPSSGSSSDNGTDGEVPDETEKPKIPDSKIPDGFTTDDLSTYFDKVRITSVSKATTNPSSYNSIALSGSISKDESVNISGWTIRGNRGSMVIPKGVEIYSPYSQNTEQDVLMKQSQQIKIYSTRGPLGKNILLNVCTGYLDSVFTFTPKLPKNCPRIDYDEITYLKGKCQDYIRSLGTCEMPNNTNPALVGDSQCKEFTDQISYRGCYDAHQNDDDFLKKEWRIWMDDSFMRLDNSHDRLLIYDRDGFIVDEYTY